jgi:hypothetical protein
MLPLYSLLYLLINSIYTQVSAMESSTWDKESGSLSVTDCTSAFNITFLDMPALS